VFTKQAEKLEAPIYFASDLIKKTYPSALLGEYQLHNKKTVQQAFAVLQDLGIVELTENDIHQGFLNVITNTGLQGRWQQLHSAPKVICDTAHNAHGLALVMQHLEKENFRTLHIVLGMVADKNLDDILPLFPKNALYYFCCPTNSRGLEAKKLQEKAAVFGLNGSTFNSVSNAYENARNSALVDDFIYVGGSTFVVAEIL
jgi:dihydrofolate synthase/folylpolyglutamate synthase